ERTNADDCLFAGSLGGVDLPVKVVIAELAGRGLDLVPVRAQSNELERIIQQPFERLARVQAHGIGLSRTKADAEECRVARLDGQLFPALGERLECFRYANLGSQRNGQRGREQAETCAWPAHLASRMRNHASGVNASATRNAGTFG